MAPNANAKLMTTIDHLAVRIRPEREWHRTIRARNEEIREALRNWLGDGDNRRLRRALRLIKAEPFDVPPSPALRVETEGLLALVLRALLVPAAPKGTLRDQRLFREAEIGRSV